MLSLTTHPHNSQKLLLEKKYHHCCKAYAYTQGLGIVSVVPWVLKVSPLLFFKNEPLLIWPSMAERVI